MKFCNKHGRKLVSYVHYGERDSETLKIKKTRTACPVCEKIFVKKVIVEKFKINIIDEIDEDALYLRDRLLSALAIPNRYFNNNNI
jgi:hypothetical protein